MDEKLLRFFKKINFNDVIAFEDTHLEDVVVNRKNSTWLLHLKSSKVVPLSSMLNLKRIASEGLDDVKKIMIDIVYENLDEEAIKEYFGYFFNEAIKNNPSLKSIKSDDIKVSDKNISITVSSSFEGEELGDILNNIKNTLEDYGLKGITIDYVVDERLREDIKNKIERDTSDIKVIPVVQESTDNHKWNYRKKVDYQRDGVVSIASIDREENGVNLEAYVFDGEFTQRTKKNGDPLYW